MLKRLMILALLAFSTLNAIDIPLPQCYPCDDPPAASR